MPKEETDLAREMRMAGKYGPGYLALAPTQKLGNAWCLAPWTGDVQGYEQARRNAEKVLGRSSAGAAGDVQLLRKAAQASPQSALAQFKWVLAANLVSNRLFGTGDTSGTIDFDEAGRMRWALALAPDPRVAEYARLRFSLEASRLSPDQGRVLARRLAARWPNDRSIKLSTARMLINSQAAPDFDEAIKIADDLLKSDPNRASYVALKGTVHETAWFRLHRRADGLAAIEWNGVYDRRFPRDTANKEELARIMAYIKKQLDGKIPLSP